MENVTYYTDGSVLLQHGYGGYAAVPLKEDGQADTTRTLCGAKDSTDIQEMELMAVITAIRSTPKHRAVTVFTDHKTICDVIARPERAKVEKGRNRNYWNQLRQLCQTREINLQWVRAHAGNMGNAAADRAARAAAKGLMSQMAVC
jgi:ribonuclease HI